MKFQLIIFYNFYKIFQNGELWREGVYHPEKYMMIFYIMIFYIFPNFIQGAIFFAIQNLSQNLRVTILFHLVKRKKIKWCWHFI